MKMTSWGQTDVGLVRERNEDHYLIDQDLGLYLVADGMGGHRGGEVASHLAVETIHGYFKSATDSNNRRQFNPRAALIQAYEAASAKVYDKSQSAQESLQGMGTTLVSAFVWNGMIYFGNVGDSRVYLLSHGQLWQLTEDHSLLSEQLRAGLITEEDLPRIGSRNIITRSVGFERDVEIDIIERELKKDELYILCSDGLYGMVPDQRLEEILASTKPQEIAAKCIEEAKKNGANDNVTTVVLYADPLNFR